MDKDVTEAFVLVLRIGFGVAIVGGILAWIGRYANARTEARATGRTTRDVLLDDERQRRRVYKNVSPRDRWILRVLLVVTLLGWIWYRAQL